VDYRPEGAVAWVTLDRPEKLNAWTARLSLDLIGALDLARAPEVRCVVITGAGKAFSAGSDLQANYGGDEPMPVDETLRRLRNPIMLAVRSLEKPVVAAVNGVAAGIGCSLAFACDLVVARESATFVPAFARLGLIPDGGSTWTTTHRAGRGRALEMAFLGEPLTAAEAAAAGLVNRVVADDGFGAAVRELAARLAAGPTAAYALAKQAIDAAAGNSFAEQLELEALLQTRAADTADFREGFAAFVERRDPRFEGR
jgi:2-(1,2-epoxy-1,2-dihydrophenyl)acetyl-CoA isomerase